MARPFAPSLLPRWTIAACTVAGGAAAWTATGLAAKIDGSDPFGLHGDGAARVLLCLWLAATHGFGAYLHSRFAPRGRSLAAWTFVISSIAPCPLALAAFRSDHFVSRSGLSEIASVGALLSIFAVPLVLAIDAAEPAPVPGRALATIGGALLVPWSLGSDRVFALGLVVSLTLAAAALGIATLAARAGAVEVHVVRGDAVSYRTAWRLGFVAVDAQPSHTDRGFTRTARAAALIAALGVFQIALVASRS